VRSSDTSPAAHEVQTRVYRRMGPATRVALAASMTDEARAVALAGIRARAPGLTDAEARYQLHVAVLGEELAALAWPSMADRP
jgi:hypothetical protein